MWLLWLLLLLHRCGDKGRPPHQPTERPPDLFATVYGLQVIRLTEEETTSSSRIFIKILFQVGGACCGWYLFGTSEPARRVCLKLPAASQRSCPGGCMRSSSALSMDEECSCLHLTSHAPAACVASVGTA